jgi:hypothetical protein
VRRRHGRLHRLFLLSANKLKSRLLAPNYEQAFDLRFAPNLENISKIPGDDTEDITAMLNSIKQKVRQNGTDQLKLYAHMSSMMETGINCKVILLKSERRLCVILYESGLFSKPLVELERVCRIEKISTKYTPPPGVDTPYYYVEGVLDEVVHIGVFEHLTMRKVRLCKRKD